MPDALGHFCGISVPSVPWHLCKTCKGRGEINGSFPTVDGLPVAKVVCPTCNGTGKP